MRTRKVLLSFALVLVPLSSANAEPKTHDGFHLQLTAGLGYYDVAAAGPLKESFSGVTIPASIMLGGAIIPGLIIGGGLMLDTAPSPTYKSNGMEVRGDIKQYILGLGGYVDYYLDAQKNGLHFQGFVGWGGLETSVSGNAGGSDPTGLVTYLGVGYEWWLSDEWSGGVMARMLYAPLKFYSTSITTIEPAIVGTLTFN